jgi:hypothetical protein
LNTDGSILVGIYGKKTSILGKGMLFRGGKSSSSKSEDAPVQSASRADSCDEPDASGYVTVRPSLGSQSHHGATSLRVALARGQCQ